MMDTEKQVVSKSNTFLSSPSLQFYGGDHN